MALAIDTQTITFFTNIVYNYYITKLAQKKVNIDIAKDIIEIAIGNDKNKDKDKGN